MTSSHLNEIEAAWREAERIWHADPTPEHLTALELAADQLRVERRATYEQDGVTDATLRETYNEDDEDDDA